MFCVINKLSSLPIFAMALFFVFTPQLALAVDSPSGAEAVRSGLSNTQDIVKLPETPVLTILGSVIGVVLSFVGVLFLILMIYGGLLWMTARGNEQQITKAKDLIIAAIIGIVIVMSAYAITAFVGGALTGEI